MRRTTRTYAARAVLATLLTLTGLATRPARAQATDSLYPLRLLDRPTTLPRGASRLDLLTIAARQPGTATGWTQIAGGGVGVTDRLEIGGQLLPLSLAPGTVSVSSPSVYATFQFPIGQASVAPTLQAVYPLADADPFFVDLSVPVYYNIGSIGYVNVAPTLSVDTRANGAGTSFALPVTFMRQVDSRLNWQLTSGVGFSRFDPRFGLSRRSEAFAFDETTIPLSALLMYSLTREHQQHPLADLTLQWQWPQLYTRAPDRRGTHANDWTIQFEMSWYAIP